MARAIRSKNTIAILSKGPPELSVPKQSPTFRTARRNPLNKHKTLFELNKTKKYSGVRASATRFKKLIQTSA